MEDFKKRTSVIWSNLSRNKTGYTFSEVPIRGQTQSCTDGSSSSSSPKTFWKRGGVKKEEDFVDLPISTQALLLDDDTPQQKTYRVSQAPFTKSASLSFLKGTVTIRTGVLIIKNRTNHQLESLLLETNLAFRQSKKTR